MINLGKLYHRLASTLTPPVVVGVSEYLRARATGALEIEDRFLWQIRLSSGVYKATHQRRFDDTFDTLRAALGTAASPLRVLDVACSSGVSTVELHRALRSCARVIETFGTDLVTSIRHVTFPDGTALLVERSGEIVAAEIDGVGVSRHPLRAMRLHHPVKVARARRLIRRRSHWERVAGVRVEDLPLISSMVEHEPGVSVTEEDILSPTVEGRFGLIRAANILNLGYFGVPRLREMIRAVVHRLDVGGVLFIVRSDGDVNNGTLWRREADALHVVARVGGGSEVEEIVNELSGGGIR